MEFFSNWIDVLEIAIYYVIHFCFEPQSIQEEISPHDLCCSFVNV